MSLAKQKKDDDFRVIQQTVNQELEQKVEDNKMIFTLCCAATYCFCLTVVCGHFAFNSEAYTGGAG